MRLHRRFAAVAVALGLILAGPAAAGPPTDQLRTQINRVIKTLEDPALQKEGKVLERRKAVRKIAEEIFDFGETAKRSLARHWQGRTPAEQQEFVGLFTDLLERSYMSKV
jgi:phospholipid transport system substrate-binding protein